MIRKNCWKEPTSGIVHIGNFTEFCGGEYTLCGDSWDRPSVDEEGEAMVISNETCNCPKCLSIARELLPILRNELKKANLRVG